MMDSSSAWGNFERGQRETKQLYLHYQPKTFGSFVHLICAFIFVAEEEKRARSKKKGKRKRYASVS